MATKYSYTKLDTYKQCPFRFYLNYILGNYAYSSSIATEFGSAIHKCEEDIARFIIAGKNIDYVSIKNNFILKNVELQKKYLAEYYAIDNKSGKTYKEKAQNYLDKGIYNLETFLADHPSYKIVDVEHKFNFEYSTEQVFTGAIDRILYDTATDTYLIQDIKSWSVPKEDDDLKTPLQFVVYTLAFQKEFALNENQINCEYYLPLVDNGISQKIISQNFVKRGVKQINKLFESISQQDYAPKQSALCNWCPYSETNPEATPEAKYLCPYHSVWTRETRNKFDAGKSKYIWKDLEDYNHILEEYNKNK